MAEQVSQSSSDDDEPENLQYKVATDRHAWIQVTKGMLLLDNKIPLEQGDGVAFSDGDILHFSANNSVCQFLLFDLP